MQGKGNDLLRRRTFQQRIWPDSPELRKLAATWAQDASAKLCEYFWKGCDAFTKEIINIAGGMTMDDLTLERTITLELEPFIRRIIPIESPYDIQHGRFETETIHSPRAQPPEYDMAFFLSENPRLNFPIEAKVLPTEKRVSEYAQEVTGNFLTCRYAPLSSEGMMLGYLVSGKPSEAFRNIAMTLGVPVIQHKRFPKRDHRLSDHVRTVPKNKPYPRQFTCHHVLLVVGSKLVN